MAYILRSCGQDFSPSRGQIPPWWRIDAPCVAVIRYSPDPPPHDPTAPDGL